jgi:A/G-specific adenine glycosylase
VLLEKRPSRGIWGGLWSLPECAPGEVPDGAQAIEPFTHAFTHFTLQVEPWLVRDLPPSPLRRISLALSDLDGAALPSPVKKLLRQLGSAA